MDVQVVYFLTALVTRVDDHPKPTLRIGFAALFERQAGSQDEHAAQQGFMLGPCLRE